jgi:hypothetical protein
VEEAKAEEQHRLLESAWHLANGSREWVLRAAFDSWLRNRALFYRLLDARAFLDAAMTLVPSGDGIGWQVSSGGSAGVWRVSTKPDDYDANRFPAPLWQAKASAATPALALTAAALRALATRDGEVG